MVFIVLHDVLLCWFQKSLGPLHIMSLLWHVMQVTKKQESSIIVFFVGQNSLSISSLLVEFKAF